MINIDLNQNPIEEVIDSLSNLKIENIDFTNLIKELENYKKIYNIVKSNRDFLEHFIYKNRDYIIYLCIKNDGKSLYLKNYMCDKIDEESKNKVLKIWFAGGEKVKLDNVIEKEKKITVIYNVIYEDQEETQEVRNIIRAKGTNTNNAEPKDKDGVKVISKGVIKNTDIEITKVAEKQEITARK